MISAIAVPSFMASLSLGLQAGSVRPMLHSWNRILRRGKAWPALLAEVLICVLPLDGLTLSPSALRKNHSHRPSVSVLRLLIAGRDFWISSVVCACMLRRRDRRPP